MKKAIVTPAQLNMVFSLRKTGFTWTDIEWMTEKYGIGKVERRLAKRAYNELVEDQRRILPHYSRTYEVHNYPPKNNR